MIFIQSDKCLFNIKKCFHIIICKALQNIKLKYEVSARHLPLVQMTPLSFEGPSPAPSSPAFPHILLLLAWTLKKTRKRKWTIGHTGYQANG